MPLLGELAPRMLRSIKARIDNPNSAGIPTGVEEIDNHLGGWQRQRITYLIGDSGRGKSWLALNWALTGAKWLLSNESESSYVTLPGDTNDIHKEIANKEGKTPVVLLWNLEMSEGEVFDRILSFVAKSELGIDLSAEDISRGTLSNEQMDDLYETYDICNSLYGQHLYTDFDDLSINDLHYTLDNLYENGYDVPLIIVDYFRLIQDSGTEGGVARQESVSAQIKQTAKEYDCHIVSLFDLSSEGAKSSTLSVNHMKWGTAAKYDSDLVLGIEWEDKEVDYDVTSTRVKLSILKNRSGKCGSFQLLLDLANGTVEPYYTKNTQRRRK